MFQLAYQEVSEFTRPFVMSRRLGNDSVDTGIGAYMLVNDDWAITAAHIVLKALEVQAEIAKWGEFEQELVKLQNNTLKPDQLAAKVRRLRRDHNADKLTRNLSVWLGYDGIQLGTTFHVDQAADLAAFQYSNAPGAWTGRAKFQTGPMQPGTSVMRFGYPFHEITATFDETSNRFDLSSGVPVPVFPIEGITTRILERPGVGQQYPVRILETSSPGLMGQSGGPIVDAQGSVLALQSETRSLRLGFKASFKDDKGQAVDEHQFLNVGYGAYAETIMGFLDQNSIAYQSV